MNLSKVNWRLLFLYFIASWLFMHSFFILSLLTNTDLLLASLKGIKDIGRFDIQEVADYTFVMHLSRPIGALSAFIISIFIAIKRKQSFLLPLLIFIASVVLNKFGLLGWGYLKNLFFLPGDFIKYEVKIIIGAILMLLLAILIFFYQYTKKLPFVDNRITE